MCFIYRQRKKRLVEKWKSRGMKVEDTDMSRRALVLFAFLLGCSSFAIAQNLDSLPSYAPQLKVSGTIRSWGNDYEDKLMQQWADGFHKFHPDVKFSNNLMSTATAIAGLYTNNADLGLMGREIWPVEELAFRRVFKYAPLGITVATGAHDVESKTFPMVVFVNKDNPISKLTLTQVDAIFGCEHKRGPVNIRTWGQVGLTGPWADKPINVYGYEIDSGFAFFFARTALNGSLKWNCNLQVFGNANGPDGKPMQAGARSLAALAADKYGIAYSGIRYRNSDVKPLALAANEGGPFIEPSKANTANRAYPLVRDIAIYINRAPGKPIEPTVREFLRFVLSREGQDAVTREGDYLPLTAAVLREQLRKIE